MISKKDLEIIKKDDKQSNILLTKYAIEFVKGNYKDEDLEKVIKYYSADRYDIELIKELLWTRYVAGCVYQQYYQYDFANKTKEQRQQYIGSYEFKEMLDSFGTKETIDLFENKYDTYLKFKEFYNRDIILVKTPTDIIKFNSFAKKHSSFIVKPIDDHGGKGIEIVDTKTADLKILFLKLISKGGAVCEELISQAEETALFHPASINTVRIVTYYDNDKLSVIYAFLRAGVNNSRVDNTSSGGLAVSIDVDTGCMNTDALSRLEKKIVFVEKHPNTNVSFKGTVVPKWDELLSLLKKLVKVVPQQKYIGWDMALTNDGWVMVEANPKPLISTIQILEQCGYREKIEKLKK